VADPTRYRISLSHAAQLQLAVLNRRASLFGQAARLAQELRHIQEQLATVPTEWGEAKSTLRGMRMLLCVGFHHRLQVRYGVHESQPLVVIREIETLPGHSLHPDPGTSP
jgi:hypothetical protein